jgi:hypothetical protein
MRLSVPGQTRRLQQVLIFLLSAQLLRMQANLGAEKVQVPGE